MFKEVDLILKLKLKGGNVVFEKFIVGDVKLDDNLVKNIMDVKKIQEELNNYKLNQNEDNRISDSYTYGPTYSSL